MAKKTITLTLKVTIEEGKIYELLPQLMDSGRRLTRPDLEVELVTNATEMIDEHDGKNKPSTPFNQSQTNFKPIGLDDPIPFPKHKGKTMRDLIKQEDKGLDYINWLLENVKPTLTDEALAFVNEANSVNAVDNRKGDSGANQDINDPKDDLPF